MLRLADTQDELLAQLHRDAQVTVALTGRIVLAPLEDGSTITREDA